MAPCVVLNRLVAKCYCHFSFAPNTSTAMQFVSEGSTSKPSYNSNNNRRDEASNPEPPRFAEDGKSLYERLKDNKEKQIQFDTERVTAGGPSAISEEEYMFFIELQRKQKQIAKQVDRETAAFQQQVQSLHYQPDTASVLTLVAKPKNKNNKSKDTKPVLRVRPKTEHSGDKRKERDEDNNDDDDSPLPAAKRSKIEEQSGAAVSAESETSGSGLSALLGYGSDSE